jgi:hypothetical protein
VHYRGRAAGTELNVSRPRTDPRRISVLALLILAAGAWAWREADNVGGDVVRFALGIGAGLALAGAIRSADGVLSARADVRRRDTWARVAGTVGAVAGVLVAATLETAGALGDNIGILLAGGFVGLLLGVGVLYPIE